jgi:hypothetical protein
MQGCTPWADLPRACGGGVSDHHALRLTAAILEHRSMRMQDLAVYIHVAFSNSSARRPLPVQEALCCQVTLRRGCHPPLQGGMQRTPENIEDRPDGVRLTCSFYFLALPIAQLASRLRDPLMSKVIGALARRYSVKSRVRPSSCNLARMDHTCHGRNGGPGELALVHAGRHGLTKSARLRMP